MKKSVLAGILLSLIIFTGLASAQVEYPDGIIAFGRGLPANAFYDPQDAKVACKPDNSMCVALVYENSTLFGRGIRILKSTGGSSLFAPSFVGKHFQNLVSGCGGWYALGDYAYAGCQVVAAPADFTINYNPPYLGVEYHYPYDIIYNVDTRLFYMVVARGLTETVLYQYDGNNPPTEVTLGASMGATSTSTVVLGCCFRNQSTFYAGWGSVTLSTSKCRTFAGYYDFFTGQLVSVSVGADVSGAYTPLSWIGFNGFGELRGSDEEYYIRDDVACNYVGAAQLHNGLGYGGTFSGLQYFDNNYLYFNYGSNSTWRASNTGASYGSPSLVHQWIANENINHSESATNEHNQLYLWDRGYTSSAGIYAYNKRLYAFKVQAKGLNPQSGVIEDISATSQIVCFDQNYSYSASGVNAILTTACLDNNSIMITPAVGWTPSFLGISNVDVLSPTDYTYLKSPASGLGFVKDYNFTLRFIDKFSSLPVPNAQVTVAGVAKVTNANGEVVFTLAPYASATVIVYQPPSGDIYYLYLNGTLKTYDYEFSRTGYQSAIGTFRLTDVEIPSSIADFRTSLPSPIQVEPNGLRLIVDVFTNDGIHYGGDSVIVRVGGAQNGSFDEVLHVPKTYATAFPTTFVLLDARSSWNVTVNLTQGAYFAQDIIAVTNTTFILHKDFTLPNSSANQQCSSDAGCASDFCSGSIWTNGGQCVGGICSYDVQSCPLLCDNVAGCNVGTTTISCPSGLDIECYGNNSCADSKHLNNYKCASDRKCVHDIVECDYMCSDHVCIPSQPVVLCDQSTVTGMLTCMQSGIMSFVGTTYNPMMTIGIVLFLVILIVAILGLGFRAVASVIR